MCPPLTDVYPPLSCTESTTDFCSSILYLAMCPHWLMFILLYLALSPPPTAVHLYCILQCVHHWLLFILLYLAPVQLLPAINPTVFYTVSSTDCCLSNCVYTVVLFGLLILHCAHNLLLCILCIILSCTVPTTGALVVLVSSERLRDQSLANLPHQ